MLATVVSRQDSSLLSLVLRAWRSIQPLQACSIISIGMQLLEQHASGQYWMKDCSELSIVRHFPFFER